MRLRITLQLLSIVSASSLLLNSAFAAENSPIVPPPPPLTSDEIIKQLGWIHTGENRCGGYYIEAPFTYSQELLNTNSVQITSDQLLFAQHGTSFGQGRVTITREGQQIIADKAYLYRDPATGKVQAIELSQNVTLREPNSLVVANHGRYVITTKSESLQDLLYRTTIYGNFANRPALPTNEELQSERKVYQLSAWGSAKDFSQDEPHIYEFDQASYSTCPPDTSVWKVRASHITLNKDTGRGSATNARITFKGVPVFYTPYLNFPIDSRRKTGFLWPIMGSSSLSGPYLKTPFYWNLAPNYDTTITPAVITKRGIQISDDFRYLSESSSGNLVMEILPNDQEFKDFQDAASDNPSYLTNPVSSSELRTLEQASSTRKSISWQNSTVFNEHWSNSIDYNWVSDDYYLRDFSNNLNQVTQNQLLQSGEIDFKSQYWNSALRVQGFQTLNQIDQPTTFNNQYNLLPQFTLGGDYPDAPGGLDYTIDNNLTHFTILNNPGSTLKFPMGNRYYSIPGISRPIVFPYMTIIPRVQFSMTQYEVGDITPPNPKDPSRTLPIFDLSSNFYFDRNVSFFGKNFRQTLEPQFYYTYIPYRNQSQLPVFDTTVNTLTYDQLFMYNRFSGIDRINDANQLAVGVTSRFINQQTGEEKIKLAAGQILYFENRRVTLCNGVSDANCQNSTDTPDNPNNRTNRSPLSGVLSYTVNPNWTATANTIWNSHTNQITNQTAGLHYQQPGTEKIINVGYNFVRAGEILPSDAINSSASNLSVTDFSFNWPVLRDWSAIGRWTQNWNHNYFQNLLYGLQYDSCCWAARIVAGRLFTNLNLNSTPEYNTQFYVQFALKGLGPIPIGGGDPSQLLSANISGYQTNFGRDF